MNTNNFMFVLGLSSVFCVHPQAKPQTVQKNNYDIKFLNHDTMAAQITEGVATGIFAPIRDSIKTVETAANNVIEFGHSSEKDKWVPSVDGVLGKIRNNYASVRDQIAQLPEAQRLSIAGAAFGMTLLSGYVELRQLRSRRALAVLSALATLLPLGHSFSLSASAYAAWANPKK